MGTNHRKPIKGWREKAPWFGAQARHQLLERLNAFIYLEDPPRRTGSLPKRPLTKELSTRLGLRCLPRFNARATRPRFFSKSLTLDISLSTRRKSSSFIEPAHHAANHGQDLPRRSNSRSSKTNERLSHVRLLIFLNSYTNTVGHVFCCGNSQDASNDRNKSS